MEKRRINTASQLEILSEWGSPENTVDSVQIEAPLSFKFSVEEDRFVNLVVEADNNLSEKGPSPLYIAVELSIEQVEHLHGWLSILLKNSTVR